MMQTAATIVTIFICVGIWLISINIIPDLLGLSPDSFIAFSVVYTIASSLMIGIFLMMKSFFQKENERKNNEFKT